MPAWQPKLQFFVYNKIRKKRKERRKTDKNMERKQG